VLTDYLIPLTVAAVVVALLALFGTVLLWRGTAAASAGLTRLEASLDERAITLPLTLASARAALAERGAAIEHVLWVIGRFDERASRIQTTMAERRAGLDATTARLEGARASVDRLKSAVRLIMRLIEIRRAFI
jgi:hypothetical protein